MFSSFKDRVTPLFTTSSQLLIQVQVKNCKLIVLGYITIVRVVFLSSPCSISVVFPMFSMCLRSLHLFVYSFKSVIQVHNVASIDLRGLHKHENWKIGLCSTFMVLKCYGFMKCKCKGWILCLLRLWAHGCNYLYLCGNAFGNVIQLEPQPSIQMPLN